MSYHLVVIKVVNTGNYYQWELATPRTSRYQAWDWPRNPEREKEKYPPFWEEFEIDINVREGRWIVVSEAEAVLSSLRRNKDLD